MKRQTSACPTIVRRLLTVLFCAAAVAATAADDNNWLRQAATRKPTIFNGANLEKPVDPNQEIRSKVTIRRLEPQCPSDWNNDATALPYFTYQFLERTQGKFPIYCNNEGLKITSPEIFDYPLIYFTSHYAFQFSEEEVEMLKKYLARGGTLLLDDCGGTGPFYDSCPPNIQRIIPGVELKLMLKESKAYQELYSLLYPFDEVPTAHNVRTPPSCAYLNGRPAVLVFPNDIGCIWEVSTPPTALEPLGGNAHGPTTPASQRNKELGYTFGMNWILYALTH
jgi:hypothetical protein